MISTDDTNYFCESKFWTFISTESWKLTPQVFHGEINNQQGRKWNPHIKQKKTHLVDAIFGLY